MTDWHALSKKEVEISLKTNEQDGLSNSEAKTRLQTYGKNELKQITKISPIMIFLEQFKSVFIIILLFAAFFSFYIKHYLDFYAIMAIILLNSAIGFIQQYKAEKTIAKMKAMLVPKVKVLREGRMTEIFSSELVPGDIIEVSEGNKIMADARIMHVSGDLEVNEAVLTGESFPQRKSSEILSLDTELANRENMLYMGTTIARGSARAVIVSTGMSTEFGKIAKLVQKIKPEKTPLEKKLDDFSKKVAVIVIVLAAISILIGLWRGQELYEMFLTGVALAISVIPEGVPAVIAITLALAIGRMKKNNSLIRKLPAAETLGRTSVICVDKTGTLTEEEMTVTKVYSNGEFYAVKNNDFYLGNKKISKPLKMGGLRELLKIGIMCNNARIEKDNRGKIINILGDSTEKAFVVSADKAGLFKKEETEREERVIEYSFSSKRKLMSIIRKVNDHKLISYVKGAPDIILARCTKEFVNGRIVALSEKRKKELHSVYENMASQALRVLGFAYREVSKNFNQSSAENDLIFVGYQGIIDPPRKEVASAVSDCITAGINLKMLTGDSLLTARAVAKMIGFPEGEESSIEEKDLRKLSDKEFNDIVRTKTVFARITPETKLRIVRALKNQGEIVAVTGDGVNDVLALKDAHISVAMGIRGSDVARDVSDIILLDDNFASIVKAVREGRRVYDNMKKSIKAHLAANVGELFSVLIALLLAWPLPLLPLAILWMNLITDSLPTLALSVEPSDRDLMKRKPIKSKETILSGMGRFLVISGIFSIIAALFLFYLFFRTDLEKARTIAMTALIFCEMFVILSCRSERNMWDIGWFSNKMLLYAIMIAIGLQMLAVYTPLSQIFDFVPLSFIEILMVIGASCLVFIFFEAQKFYRNKKAKPIS